MAIDKINATALLDGGVSSADIADGAVTGVKIANGAVDTTQLANDAVSTDKIIDGNVTVGKLASTLDLSSNTVTLPDGSVSSAKLDTNIDVAGTLDVTGTLTADADIVTDNGRVQWDSTNNRFGISGHDSPTFSSYSSVPFVVTSNGAEVGMSLDSVSANGRSWDMISGGSGGYYIGGRFGIYDRDSSTGLLSLSATTGGTAGGTTGKGVGFDHAGVWFDRGWGNYPALTVTSTSGTGQTNQSEIRVHGTNATWGSYPTPSGADFGCSLYIDGSVTQTSDRRYKTNITSISNALDTVNAMDGKRFQTLTSDGTIETDRSAEDGFKFGFIAQDLESLGLGEVYKHYADEDDGTDGYNKAYSVDYASLTALLVNAIKELSVKVDDLTTRIETLENA